MLDLNVKSTAVSKCTLPYAISTQIFQYFIAIRSIFKAFASMQ